MHWLKKLSWLNHDDPMGSEALEDLWLFFLRQWKKKLQLSLSYVRQCAFHITSSALCGCISVTGIICTTGVEYYMSLAQMEIKDRIHQVAPWKFLSFLSDSMNKSICSFVEYLTQSLNFSLYSTFDASCTSKCSVEWKITRQWTGDGVKGRLFKSEKN